MPRRDRVFWDDIGSSTRVRAHFHGVDGKAYSGNVESFRPDFGEIIACSSSKDMSSPSGSWSLVVKRPDRFTHERWMALWRDPEGTWVDLEWIVNGQRISGMLGNIDTVSYSKTVGENGARSYTYTIAGRDHGKAFENTMLWINIFDGGSIRNRNAMYQTMTERIDGTPAFLVRGLMEAWLGNYRQTDLQWVLPPGLGGKALYDVLDLTNIAPMTPADGTLIDASLINLEQSGTSLWATMTEYANVILNEMWVDLVPRFGSPSLSGMRPGVYMRRRPFPTASNRASWESLRTHVLEPNDVKGENISRHGGERFNYWQLRIDPQNHATDAILQTAGGAMGTPGSNPIWSIDSIRVHGVKRWMQSTKFLQMDNEAQRRTLAQLAANWLLMCHDWYVVGPYQLSGSITTTRVFPEIRVGQKVRLLEASPKLGYTDFYVEAITHSWTHGAAGSSTITLTRGERDTENHLAMAYADAGYSAQQMAFVRANPNLVSAAIPNAPATLDEAITAANREMDGDTTNVFDAEETSAPLVSEMSEADFSEIQDMPSDPSMVNPLPPPSITEGNAAIAFDESGGETESPTDVAPEPGELSPAPATQENAEDGRPVFIELDLEVVIGPGSAVVMGPDGLPIESED